MAKVRERESGRKEDSEVSRRRFLGYAGIGVVAGVFGVPFAEAVLRKAALRIALGSEAIASGGEEDVVPVNLQLAETGDTCPGS